MSYQFLFRRDGDRVRPMVHMHGLHYKTEYFNPKTCGYAKNRRSTTNHWQLDVGPGIMIWGGQRFFGTISIAFSIIDREIRREWEMVSTPGKCVDPGDLVPRSHYTLPGWAGRIAIGWLINK